MSAQTVHEIGIVMNGVTGRMGLNQHLRRSIWAIMQQGGVRFDDEVIMPRPLLVGRNPVKLEQISRECGGVPWTVDLDAALADPAYSVYFDAQTTDRRAPAVRKAIAAGKHIYCEKPSADSLAAALDIYHRAEAAGVKHGVVLCLQSLGSCTSKSVPFTLQTAQTLRHSFSSSRSTHPRILPCGSRVGLSGRTLRAGSANKVI